MKEEKDLIEFDDSDAIEFIINTLNDEEKQNIDEDTIQYVLDLICDYYDENGLIEDDTVEESDIAEDDIFNYVSALAKKEKIVTLSDEQIQAILDGEFEYGCSIGIYSKTED